VPLLARIHDGSVLSFSAALTRIIGERFIYTGSASGSIHVYDMLTGRTESKLTGHYGVARNPNRFDLVIPFRLGSGRVVASLSSHLRQC
jgi:hypothetical protein